MIVTSNYTRDDGVNLIVHESDKGLYIIQEQTGKLYDKAIDVPDRGFTYRESEITIETD